MTNGVTKIAIDGIINRLESLSPESPSNEGISNNIEKKNAKVLIRAARNARFARLRSGTGLACAKVCTFISRILLLSIVSVFLAVGEHCLNCIKSVPIDTIFTGETTPFLSISVSHTCTGVVSLTAIMAKMGEAAAMIKIVTSNVLNMIF